MLARQLGQVQVVLVLNLCSSSDLLVPVPVRVQSSVCGTMNSVVISPHINSIYLSRGCTELQYVDFFDSEIAASSAPDCPEHLDFMCKARDRSDIKLITRIIIGPQTAQQLSFHVQKNAQMFHETACTARMQLIVMTTINILVN